MSDKLTKDQRSLIIQKEIPVDFQVTVDKYNYSFNLREEIFLKSEIESGGKYSTWSQYFHPIRIENEKIFVFEKSDGRWSYAMDEIQKAYKNYLIESTLLDG